MICGLSMQGGEVAMADAIVLGQDISSMFSKVGSYLGAIPIPG